MTILTEPGNHKHTVRAVAFAAHPALGNTVADVVLNNNGTPLGQRIRNLVASVLGEEWTVMDWYPAEGEF
ncbi:hypothetical protein [Pantanalinema sp. GBBB05]|uniref:hypothetical protein n=1 Tax=Pantanalinema sp. GBBB05 TaxID=2604139 RepID=UPI001D7D2B71|nr:hypothetical protein [Pantanalinema sp. GBBB05]